MKTKKGYLVLKCIKSVQVIGALGGNIAVPCENKKEKLFGMAPIYTTKREAKKASENGRFRVLEIEMTFYDEEKL